MILNINAREKARYLKSEFGAKQVAVPFKDAPEGQMLVVVAKEWVMGIDTPETRAALTEEDTYEYFYLNTSLVHEMSAVELLQRKLADPDRLIPG